MWLSLRTTRPSTGKNLGSQVWRHNRTHKSPAGKMNIINQPIILAPVFLFQASLTTDFTPYKLPRIFTGLPLHRSPLPCSNPETVCPLPGVR